MNVSLKQIELTLVLFLMPLMMFAYILNSFVIKAFWLLILSALTLVLLLGRWHRVAKTLQLLLKFPQPLVFILLLLFLGLSGIAYIRSYFANAIELSWAMYWIITWSLIFIMAIAWSSDNHGDLPNLKILFYLCQSYNIYLVINVVLFLFGFQTERGYGEGGLGISSHPSVMLGYLGIEWSRVAFPFSMGINSIGGVAGLAVVFNLVLLRTKKPKMSRTASLFLAMIAISIIIMVDTRGPLLYASVAAFPFLLAPRLAIKAAPYLAIGILFMPLLLYFLLVEYAPSYLFENISRGLTPLSGRELIWLGAIDFMRQQPMGIISGYGLFGQVITGITEYYDILFVGEIQVGETIRSSLHNFALQTIIDTGIIGLLTITMLILSCLRWIKRSHRRRLTNKDEEPMHYVMSALILYLLLYGSTELSLNIYRFEYIVCLIFIAAYASILNIHARHQLITRVE